MMTKLEQIFTGLVIFLLASCAPNPTKIPEKLFEPGSGAVRAVLQIPTPLQRMIEGSKKVITPANVARLQILTQLGSGHLTAFWWSPDGSSLVVVTQDGTFTYHPQTLERTDFLRGVTESSELPTNLYNPPRFEVRLTEFKEIIVRRVSDNSIVQTFDDLVTPDHLGAYEVSADGQLLALAGWNQELKVLRISDGKVVVKIPLSHLSVNQLAFSPDNDYIAVSDFLFGIWIWRLHNAELIGRLEIPRPYGQIADNRQQFIATGSHSDSLTHLWRLEDGSLVGSFDGAGPGVVSPDGALLANQDQNYSIQLYNLSDGSLYHKLVGHTGKILELAFSPDGSLLASGGEDHTGRLWRVSDGDLVQKFEDHSKRVETVVFSPDGRFLVTAGADARVNVWQIPEGSKTLEFNMKSDQSTVEPGGTMAAKFSPDGAILAIWEAYDEDLSDQVGYIRLYRVDNWELILELSQPAHPFINELTFSPDSSLMATTGDQVSVWRISDGQLLYTLGGREPYCSGIAFSPDGQVLVTGHRNDILNFWRVSDGALLRELQGMGDRIEFAKDGKVLVTNGTQIWGIIQD